MGIALKDGVKRNKIIYYLLLITSITGSWTVIPKIHKVYMFHVFIALFTINVFINMFEENRIKIPKLKIKNILSFIFVWYFYISITFFWAESMTDYIKTFMLYTLAFYFLLIIVLNNNDLKDLKTSVKIMAICFIAAVVIGLLESKTNFRLWGSSFTRRDLTQYNLLQQIKMMTRPTAYFHNTNNYATFIMFGIAFLISDILYSKFTIKNSVLLVLSLFALYLSKSRANQLAIIIILAAFILMKFRLNIKDLKTRKRLIVSITAMIMIIFLIIIIPKTSRIIDKVIYKVEDKIDAVSELDFSSSESNSTKVRGVLMQNAFRTMRENPLGVGAGNAPYYLGLAQNTSNLSVHNWFLELWVDFGFQFFIGYMIFYIMLNVFLYKCMIDENAEKELRIIAGGCFMSHLGFIIGMISPSGILYFLPYWLLTGISFSAINIHRKSLKVN